MSKFDKKLFYTLCNKYNVKLCDKYNSPMLKVGDEIREVKEEDVKNILKIENKSFNRKMERKI